MIGIIPAIMEDEPSPVQWPCPLEMVPVDYQVCEGERRFHPVSQIAVEGLVTAGAAHIVIALPPHKADLMKYYRSGQYFGVPIAYVCPEREEMLAAIDAAYPLACGRTAIVTSPAITDVTMVSRCVENHLSNEADLTCTVAQNTLLDNGHLKAFTPGQLTGVFVFSSYFTNWLREQMCETPPGCFEDALRFALQGGMHIHGVKGAYSPRVNGAEGWSKAIHMVKPQAVFIPLRD